MRKIDADDLLEEFENYDSFHSPTIEEVRDTIRDFPTVDEWIPCRVERPKTPKDVLVSTAFLTEAIMRWTGEYWKSDIGMLSKESVIAWMPSWKERKTKDERIFIRTLDTPFCIVCVCGGLFGWLF